MKSLEIITRIRDEEAEYIFCDWTLVEALDEAIEILSGGKPEGSRSRSKAAKRLIDLKDELSHPDEEETDAVNTAIIALLIAA